MVQVVDPDWRPDWIYVPGQTERHPEGLFDPLRAQLPDRFERQAVAASPAWSMALGLLRDGYYWEAHEVLEPIWLICPEGGADRSAVQALIQLANAGLKRGLGWGNAVKRLTRIADDLAGWAAEQDGAALGIESYYRLRPIVLGECAK